ncbi:DUF2779 domain-containing protein [Bizionia myxarmorum]|uniref:DUF2779 domain-containing protein n=1 Tax=Bizionia myxarmorum TaxID=291186 RepID=A0A5D0RCR7_9FLAO|nr:DUF2779 domain-containing protein [Bizionia myxarmorum]TYB79183.1 DUF2779 domain-containing protein [Bizionia myxarmorum]
MSKPKPRHLTKSRFKLALDCPTKLFYTRKEAYENQSETDSFLQGLAQGGFQVEELARMYYPDGIAILGDDWNYDLLAQKTAALLEQENVTIFEAAFLHDGLFIRVDILEKKGNNINLIEVKAKSMRSANHQSFFNGNGSLGGGWTTFLYDIAFQKFVIQKCHPNWQITSFLKLVDKDATTTVDGLNQFFKVATSSDNRTGIIKKEGISISDLGESILTNISVNEEVNYILSENPVDETKSFSELVNYYLENYINDTKLKTAIGGHCKGCEYYLEHITPETKSGFHECWQEQLKLSHEAINQPKSYDVWFNPAKNALDDGRYFMKQLTENDFNIKIDADKLSRSERQWLQIEKEINQDTTPYVDLVNLRNELASWKYPLNFIDFETTAVAIPFLKNLRPYEQLAFQFSHHIVYEDGRLEHHHEYLNTEIGVFPNFHFIRALKESLSVNDGSILRYHNHENTIVNVIYNQLQNSNEEDKTDLMDFIQSISHSTNSSSANWTGDRDMIDLQRTVVNYYYDPITVGSNSIKAILPAVLHSSTFLQEKYKKPIGDINLTSKNFNNTHVFIQMENGMVVSPYKNLPPIFEGFDYDTLEAAAEHASQSVPEIADGGAALFAYGKLQFLEMPIEERDAIHQGLLRYCELDTLAMVMIYEYFKDITNQ